MKTNTMKTKKGFTLLELLIVIGILAILSTTIVLVINPAELLKKARDSQRISDLSTLKTAIAYYITETAAPDIGSFSTAKTYSDVNDVNCGGTAASTSTATTVDGDGWIPIKFDELAGGSPISALPIDPNPTAAGYTDGKAHYYVYVTKDSNLTFELLANMESAYYSNGGAGDVESKDGGASGLTYLYEIGTELSIITASATNCLMGDGS